MLKYHLLKTVFRFLLCWIISALIIGTLMFLMKYFIFKFKLRDDWNSFRYYSWTYEVESMLFLFFFVSIFYLIFWDLIKRLKRNVKAIIGSLIWAGLFATGMIFIPYILTMNVVQIIIYWFIMVFLGLLLPLIDRLALKFLNKKDGGSKTIFLQH